MPHRARSERLLRSIAFLLIAALLTLSGFSIAQADPAAITQAQEDAQKLKELINKLDEDLSMADEDYNQASERLKETKAAEADTQTKLNKAERKLDGAQQQLLRRLADIYKGGRADMLEVFFGATSLTDMVNRMGQLQRISEKDSQLVAEVEDYLGQVKQHKADLAQQKEDEQVQVQRLAEAKKKVEEQLTAQQKALQGKETQIAQLQQEERARQAQLAAAARAAAAKAAAEADRQAKAEAAAKAATATSQAKLRVAANETTSEGSGTSTKTSTKSSTVKTSTTKTTSKSSTGTTSKPRPTTTTEKPSSGGSSSGGGSASGTRAKVIDIAMNYLGVPYVWGGESPKGFDCSGFVLYVMAKVGIDLPHSSAMQYAYGSHVSKSELKPGDLVFFYSPIHHVGIYIGDGQMINARTGGVQIDNAFWSSYVGATRVID